MTLNFTGDVSSVAEGIRILETKIGFERGMHGVPVHLKRRNGNLEIKAADGEVFVEFQEKIHFFRALAIIAENLSSGITSFEINERPRFTTSGVMVDCSRNAVLSTGSIKDITETMAVMGLNMLMLYTEDTYEVEAYPYFGYMRGRYTYEELKQCDDYADIFGIEIVPCIQTLAHLASALKWNYAPGIRDTEDILLIGADSTYMYIEEMIKSACKPFRSKRIHIGMDEAHLVGLGTYLSQNGYRNRFDVMNEHLARVNEIADRCALKPMMWSDMYFRLCSATGDYYDENVDIPQKVICDIPKNIQMVYWDYYHDDSETYRRLIRQHKKMGTDMVFAGGVWTWGGISVNYPLTFATTNAALAACKDEGVDEVIATMWGDNGGETNFFSALLGMQLFAEHSYAGCVENEQLKKRFKACTGQDMDAFLMLSELDPRKDGADLSSNPSKYMLWQDILIGLFDKNLEGFDYSGYYRALAPKLKKAAESAGKYSFIFDAAAVLADTLAIKAEMGIRLKAAYDAGNTDELRRFADKHLPELRELVEKLRLSHMRQWFATNKPFGWEVIDIRFGGLLARIDTAIRRTGMFVEGEIASIPELSQTRLYFDMADEPCKEGDIPRCNLYHRIASASVMAGV